MRRTWTHPCFVVTLLALVAGCESKPADWPPARPAKAPVADFKKSSTKIDGWTHVHESRESSKGGGRRALGMAYLIKDGHFELPYNLFAIDAPAKRFVESQFEVVYFDEKRTQIRAVKAEGDSVALIKGNSAPGAAMAMSHSFTCPGTKVRCAGKLYELHADGWHYQGKVVHAFAPGASKGKEKR